MIHINPSDSKPIWSQVEEGVRALIAAGVLPVGSAVPSVRDLARELQINPATASKAYQRLVAAGLLEVRRGDGTYVAEAPAGLAAAARDRTLGEAATRYTRLAVEVGARRDEALDRVADAWQRITGGGDDTPAGTDAARRRTGPGAAGRPREPERTDPLDASALRHPSSHPDQPQPRKPAEEPER